MITFTKRLRIVNRIISIFLVFIALYIIYFGLEPEINLAIVKAYDKTEGYVYKGNTASQNGLVDQESLKPAPDENRLIIPKIRVNGYINEGESSDTLDRGLWRRPETSKPDLGSNTVITAHRFLYKRGPNTFYHLNKLSKGDDIIIFWEGKEYLYKIDVIDEIEPDYVEVEKSTKEDILTLYTCTPLYTSDKRLVVVAKLVEDY